MKKSIVETNANVISSVIATKKFVSLDYSKLSAKEQKRFRSKIRTKLFAIVNDYLRMKLQKELNVESAKTNFELFKKFVAENYSIPLSESQNIFKGNGEKLKDFNNYIIDLKIYLSESANLKAPKSKAKK